MPKESASDLIMASGKMKPLLTLSKEEPIGAAIGLTSDGEGLLLLDKKAKPRKVLANLRAAAASSKVQLNTGTLRFGRAQVDVEYDPGMVRLFVNKEAPGMMRAKLVEVVKRGAYQRVEINVDPSLDEEDEGDALATSEVPAAPPPPAPAADPAALRRVLAALAARIPAAAGDDPAKRGILLKLANAANEGLKAGEIPLALQGLAQLRAALEPSDSGTAPAQPALRIWTDAKDAVDQQLEQLYGKLRKTGLPVLGEVANEIEGVLERFRVGLVASLMNYDKATPDKKGAARDAALEVVADYKARLPADKHVIAADTNPFGVPVSVRSTLGAALERLSGQLAA